MRICSYNFLWFGSADTTARGAYHRTVMNQIQPDLLVGLELENPAGADYYRDSVLPAGEYEHTPFYGSTTNDEYDVCFFYKTSRFSLVSTHSVTTDLRNVEVAEFEFVDDPSAPHIYLAGTHLKASSGTTNEERRLAEINDFLSYIQTAHIDTANLFFCGDMNFYGASEPGYQALLADSNFVDPLNSPGEWHNNASFASIHTQATRTEQLPDGGVTGGLDDRFDFILPTPALFDGDQWEYLEDSYTPYGNDGQHFNLAINAGTNSAVPDSVADALYYATDHLPVYLEIDRPNANSPQITIVQPGEGSVLDVSSPVDLTWTLTTQVPVQYTLLAWSPDRGENWNPIDSLDGAPVSYTWTTPDSFSAYNLLRVQAVDSLGRLGEATSGTFGIAPHDVTSDTLSAGWHLVSLPLNPEDGSVAAVLGDDISGNFDVYIYDGTPEYGTPDSLTSGAGYWLRLDESSQVDAQGMPAIVFDHPLDFGWNLFGTGLEGDLPLDSLRFELEGEGEMTYAEAVDAGWILPGAYGVDFDSAGYNRPDVVEPWNGYWLFADRAGLTLEARTPESGNRQHGAPPSSIDEVDNWQVNVVVEGPGGMSDLLSFGVLPGATNGYDPTLEGPLPPAPPMNANWVSAGFHQASWHRNLTEYVNDFRSALGSADTTSWDITVQSSEQGSVTLRFPGIADALPIGYTAIADGPEGSVDLLETPELTFEWSEDATVTVTVISPDLDAPETPLNGLPSRFAITDAYPNPFNPEMTVVVALPHAAPLHVAVYDLLGRRVATLASGTQSAGYHRFTLRGSNMASGIYFVRATVPGEQVQVKKVVLVR